MPREIYITPKCPIRTTMELIGGKWKLIILVQLFNDPVRLKDLKASIPDISEKMLIQELKTLVESKLVARKAFEEVPKKVEYQLTSKGKLVIPLIKEMKKFATAYMEESGGG